MPDLIPVWILGAPFVGVLILAFSFKGPSSMGGHLPRPLPRTRFANHTSSPVLQPTHPDRVRKNP